MKSDKTLKTFCPFCLSLLVQSTHTSHAIFCRGWYGMEPCDFEYIEGKTEAKYKPLNKAQKDNKQVKLFEILIETSFEKLKRQVSFTRASNSLHKMNTRLTR